MADNPQKSVPSGSRVGSSGDPNRRAKGSRNQEQIERLELDFMKLHKSQFQEQYKDQFDLFCEGKGRRSKRTRDKEETNRDNASHQPSRAKSRRTYRSYSHRSEESEGPKELDVKKREDANELVSSSMIAQYRPMKPYLGLLRAGFFSFYGISAFLLSLCLFCSHSWHLSLKKLIPSQTH